MEKNTPGDPQNDLKLYMTYENIYKCKVIMCLNL